jgi:hypothetical protein
MAPGLTDALLHTWPLAYQIDDAVETWTRGPDPHALAVLARACRVLAMALGWPDTIDRTWPMPDPDWIIGQTGEGDFRVVPRGPRDGAPAIASVLNACLDHADPIQLPPLAVVQGDELYDQLSDLLEQARNKAITAIRFETPVPWDPESRAALDAIDEALPAQKTFRLYGHAGLLCPDTPSYEDLLDTAPAQPICDKPMPHCDAVVLPFLDEDGRMGKAGALAWNTGAYAPVLVHPFAVDAIEQFDGTKTAADVADSLSVKPELMHTIVQQLAELGALGA